MSKRSSYHGGSTVIKNPDPKGRAAYLNKRMRKHLKRKKSRGLHGTGLLVWKGSSAVTER